MASKITPPDNPLGALIEHVAIEIIKGVRHGNFDFQISGKGNHNGKRTVDFYAGLSHRYTVHYNDIPRNTIPQLTFQPKANFYTVQQQVTSQPDALSGMEHSNEDDTG